LFIDRQKYSDEISGLGQKSSAQVNVGSRVPFERRER